MGAVVGVTRGDDPRSPFFRTADAHCEIRSSNIDEEGPEEGIPRQGEHPDPMNHPWGMPRPRSAPPLLPGPKRRFTP